MSERPTQADLAAAFHFDLENGRLFWKEHRHRPDLIGKEAGFADNYGYVRVCVKRRKYLRSHLIFCAVTGRWPERQVDHRNRNRSDDRPSNLREVEHSENMWNRTPMSRDLPMGVTAKDGKFIAKIMHNRKLHYLGRFKTPEQAQAAYQSKRTELYGEYA